MFSEKRTEFSEILAFSLNEWMCLGYFGLILFEKNKIKCFHNFQCNVCVRVEKFKIDNEKKERKNLQIKKKFDELTLTLNECTHTKREKTKNISVKCVCLCMKQKQVMTMMNSKNNLIILKKKLSL